MSDHQAGVVSAHPGGDGIDRRRAERRSVLRDGRLLTVEGLGPLVLIVDISSTGALIRLRTPLVLPQDLVLVDRLPMMAHRAVIARRHELDVGLRFIRSQSLSGTVPSALAEAAAWCRARPAP